MKLSFCSLGCPGWDLATIAKRGAEYGFDGVELRIGGDKHVDTVMDTDHRSSVRRLFDDAGLAICAVSGYTLFNNTDRASLEKNKTQLLQNIGLAVDLGASFVRTFMGEGLPEGDIGIRAEYLHDCGETALARGVTVLIETHDANKSGKRCAEIIQAADSRGIGALWDIHHPLSVGEQPTETWAHMGRYVKHLHLKDARDGKLCHMGEGILPIKEIMDILKAQHFDGYLSFEWEKMWIPELDDPEIAFPKYVTLMRGLMQPHVY